MDRVLSSFTMLVIKIKMLRSNDIGKLKFFKNLNRWKSFEPPVYSFFVENMIFYWRALKFVIVINIKCKKMRSRGFFTRNLDSKQSPHHSSNDEIFSPFAPVCSTVKSGSQRQKIVTTATEYSN